MKFTATAIAAIALLGLFSPAIAKEGNNQRSLQKRGGLERRTIYNADGKVIGQSWAKCDGNSCHGGGEGSEKPPNKKDEKPPNKNDEKPPNKNDEKPHREKDEKDRKSDAIIPQRNKSIDCGMYLLQFFEDLIMDPEQFIEKIQKEGYVFERGRITDRKKMIEIFNQLSENKLNK